MSSMFSSSFEIEGQPIGVSGPLTDTELRASPIDVNATFTPSGTQNVNVVSTVAVPVSGPLTDTELRATPVKVTESGSTATVAQQALVANTSATAFASNANRTSAIIYSPTQPLYIKFGATASNTSFTYKITSNGSTTIITGYNGRIDVMSQNGQTINVTEVTY